MMDKEGKTVKAGSKSMKKWALGGIAAFLLLIVLANESDQGLAIFPKAFGLALAVWIASKLSKNPKMDQVANISKSIALVLGLLLVLFTLLYVRALNN